LTNAAKHSHANVVNVELDTEVTVMQLALRDDGIGLIEIPLEDRSQGLSPALWKMVGSRRRAARVSAK
jgi:signal transduction histidine kinase